MRYRARVAVYPKPVMPDPEGESVKNYLIDRGYRWLREIRCGKFWEIIVEAKSRREAKKLVNKICLDPLANVVKDDFLILKIEEIR